MERKRKAYRFTLDPNLHKDLIVFIEYYTGYFRIWRLPLVYVPNPFLKVRFNFFRSLSGDLFPFSLLFFVRKPTE